MGDEWEIVDTAAVTTRLTSEDIDRLLESEDRIPTPRLIIEGEEGSNSGAAQEPPEPTDVDCPSRDAKRPRSEERQIGTSPESKRQKTAENLSLDGTQDDASKDTPYWATQPPSALPERVALYTPLNLLMDLPLPTTLAEHVKRADWIHELDNRTVVRIARCDAMASLYVDAHDKFEELYVEEEPNDWRHVLAVLDRLRPGCRLFLNARQWPLPSAETDDQADYARFCGIDCARWLNDNDAAST